MESAPSFHDRCQHLFSDRLGHGRRWKTAAAQALGIGRATLYRYFEEGAEVAAVVLARLADLERGDKPVRDDRSMVVLLASALVDVQKQIDERGWLKDGYPPGLRRVLDLAAARNIQDGDLWPTSLADMARLAQEPLYKWGIDLSWDVEGEFAAAKLIDGGEITTECVALAQPGKNPETELEENLGYKLLLGLCRDRRDGQQVYVAWRRAVVENPVLPSWTTTLLSDPVLATVERIDEVVDAFYQRVPEAMAISGMLPICTVSGTILRQDGRAFHTESRDPEARRRARAGKHATMRFRPGMLYLRRPFRTFWCLPGKAELVLHTKLTKAGWMSSLWPDLDRVDLVAMSPGGQTRIAVDVKDYVSPENLASRFEGFKGFAETHRCYVAIPDHIPEITLNFEARFEAIRASRAKANVRLRTISDLLDELEIAP
ncbi:HU-CCDC81 and SPOR domain-containing protein [Azospirillum sp. TSH64]|uniref:pPIWI_RE_Y domain-containing protein n=1 Tax=Azospirillum sp. TSH64 TaxID=652740 RepID=UPI000D60C0B6|nr:HU-CCDC81 and SPOR domain-containing protein [Azospirillum sp. TSH64]PWC76377.1 hypothetical protein TSH64_17090 [Azospirillum sp. TSH64]